MAVPSQKVKSTSRIGD